MVKSLIPGAVTVPSKKLFDSKVAVLLKIANPSQVRLRLAIKKLPETMPVDDTFSDVLIETPVSTPEVMAEALRF